MFGDPYAKYCQMSRGDYYANQFTIENRRQPAVVYLNSMYLIDSKRRTACGRRAACNYYTGYTS
jgi:hypothetical protein